MFPCKKYIVSLKNYPAGSCPGFDGIAAAAALAKLLRVVCVIELTTGATREAVWIEEPVELFKV